MADEGYKSTDLEFPDDDTVVPPSSPAVKAEAEPQISPAAQPVVSPSSSSKGKDDSGTLSPELKDVLGDPDLDEWDKPSLESVDDYHRRDNRHTFRNIIICITVAVAAVVGGGVLYKKGCEDDSKTLRPPQPTASVPSAPEAPVAPVPVAPPVAPPPPAIVPPTPIEQPPVEVIKCDFSSEPPGNLKWNCGSKVVKSSIEFDEKKSTEDAYGGVFTFTTAQGQDVNCAFTLQKPKDRTKQQRLDSSLDCK